MGSSWIFTRTYPRTARAWCSQLPGTGRRCEASHAPSEIQTSGLDGSNPKRLTDDLYLNTAPSWSPDGTRVAFLRDRFRLYGKEVEGIYTMASDGSDQRRITILQDRAAVPGEVQSDRNHSAGPMWSPNGQLLAYVLQESAEVVVEIADLRAAPDERGSRHPEVWKVWSPLGR